MDENFNSINDNDEDDFDKLVREHMNLFEFKNIADLDDIKSTKNHREETLDIIFKEDFINEEQAVTAFEEKTDIIFKEKQIDIVIEEEKIDIDSKEEKSDNFMDEISLDSLDSEESEIEDNNREKLNQLVVDTNYSQKTLEDYISGNMKFNSISENIDVCISLAKLFKIVHDLGYCFNGVVASDFSVDTNKNCSLVNDNKVVLIESNDRELNIEKTCAPEIIRGESLPNLKTDYHTLAYIIFGLLFRSDPFEGSKVLDSPCYSKSQEIEYYKNPIFVYNKDDDNNRPVFGIHGILIKYWNRYYTDDIKNIFIKSFVDGLLNPSERQDEAQILNILSNFKSSLKLKVKQPKVDILNTDIKKDEPKNIESDIKESNKYQLCITSNLTDSQNSDKIIYDLRPGLEIINSMIGYRGLPDDKVVGKVIENSKHKGVIGIKNLSNYTWIRKKYNDKDNDKKDILPGKVLVINSEIEIDFYPENQSDTKNIWKIR